MVVMFRAMPEPGKELPRLTWLTWYGNRPDSRLDLVGEQYTYA
jgi:hypothetical protein